MNYGEKDIMPGSRMGIAGMLRQELFQAKLYMEKKSRKKFQQVKKTFEWNAGCR